MSFCVDVTKTLIDQTGIDLSRRDISMTQHLLNGVDIGTIFQQVSREGVA